MALCEVLKLLGEEPALRGRRFERLCKWYLENAPEYRLRLKNVWLWDEWPSRWGPDTGIDLVAETHDGALWAIQAKSYQPTYGIKKTDVDTFLSESSRSVFAFRLLIATTDLISANAYRTLSDQEKPVGLVFRSHLEVTGVEWPDDLDLLAPSKPHRLERLAHQQEAVRNVLAGFESADRGQLIMACGTGKTLIALWVAEDLGSERTLVLVPSLTLLSQTLREWTANAAEPFDYLAVCSDETVAEHDAMVSRTADLGLPVTTEPAAVESFLKVDGRRVVFATYHSSRRIAEAFARGAPPFDLVIADEAHRCAGPATSDFATILADDRIRSRYKLFMTATPRYFSGRVRKVASEVDFELASMDDESKFGPVLHRLTFGEAIERDLLCDYVVVVVGVDEDSYRAQVEERLLVTPDGHRVTDARTLASHIGLAKAMRRYDLRRTISFHGRISKAQLFSSTFPAVVDWMPADERPDGSLWSQHVSGEMPSGRRDVLLGRFRNLEQGTRGLLCNARCLAEGVDVPAIDGITFIDPRRSTIDIVQAVGRAIRRSPEKKLGVVVLPVFIGEGDDPEEVLEYSSFEAVWGVLRALRAHDEVLGEQLDALRRRLGREAHGSVTRPDKIVIMDLPARVGEAFARAFDVRLVECTTSSWEFWFGLLQRFVDHHGHAGVVGSWNEGGFRLGAWVKAQRVRYGKRTLRRDRIEALERLPGWNWRIFDPRWEEGFGKLTQFVRREGHARVPTFHVEDGFRLGRWVSGQRKADQIQGRLWVDRRRRLEGLAGWTWNAVDAAWEHGLAGLEGYVEREGHAQVPKGWVEGDFKLGTWVSARRWDWRVGRLRPDQVSRLEALRGWTWNTLVGSWEKGFALLMRFVEEEGNARVPQEVFRLSSLLRGTTYPLIMRSFERRVRRQGHAPARCSLLRDSPSLLRCSSYFFRRAG
jgi:superfamily II DNA or RNA helicase